MKVEDKFTVSKFAMARNLFIDGHIVEAVWWLIKGKMITIKVIFR